MEWIAEGLALCFIGALVFIVNIWGGTDVKAPLIVYRACAGMLIVMALLTLFTGARTPLVPIKICPAVKTVIAVMIIIGSYI